MWKQKPRRIENPVLKQSERRKRIDVYRKYFQEHKIPIILTVIGTAIAFLILLLNMLSYYGQ